MYVIFFFFKQKTAYEMRISDWSSDVCSSDLAHTAACATARCDVARRHLASLARACDLTDAPRRKSTGGTDHIVATGRGAADGRYQRAETRSAACGTCVAPRGAATPTGAYRDGLTCTNCRDRDRKSTRLNSSH